MGERPPPHGRSPTAPWALAHRTVGDGYVPERNTNWADWYLAFGDGLAHLGNCGVIVKGVSGEFVLSEKGLCQK